MVCIEMQRKDAKMKSFGTLFGTPIPRTLHKRRLRLSGNNDKKAMRQSLKSEECAK